MMGIYRAAILSFFLPLVTALCAIYMPESQPMVNYIILEVYLANIVIYMATLAVFKKKKKQNAARLAILLNMLAFCFYFTFPLIKAFIGHTWLQLLLFAIFLLSVVLGVYDQKQEVPIVFPGTDKEVKKIANVFYAIPVIIVFLGGGGSIMAVRNLADFFGQGYVTYWGGACLYILGCWFAFFFQSLFYQGLFKNGMWVK